jgi:hypothetical protein
MCNPLFDIQVEASDEVLNRFGFEKGGMYLVDQEKQRDMVKEVYTSIVNSEPGGSGANTVSAAAMLGSKTVYTGRVGNDEHAQMYSDGLQRWGVKPNLGQGEGETGICLVVVSPDAQRTMMTCLGCSQQLSRQDVSADDIKNSKFIYVTGYLWDTETQKEAVTYAMEQATQNGVKVALSLSDPFCVNRHQVDFRRLVRDHVNVLFGNSEEIRSLTGFESMDEAAKSLGELCETVAITLDSKGSMIVHNREVHSIPAYPVHAVDTTGAGDTYAAGILHGLAKGLPIPETGRLASRLAAKVVSKMGPRLTATELAEVV